MYYNICYGNFWTNRDRSLILGVYLIALISFSGDMSRSKRWSHLVVTCQGQGHHLRSNSYIYRSKLTWTFEISDTHRYFILDIHILINWSTKFMLSSDMLRSRSSVKIKGQSIVQSEVQGRRLCDCDPTFRMHIRAAMLV